MAGDVYGLLHLDIDGTASWQLRFRKRILLPDVQRPE